MMTLSVSSPMPSLRNSAKPRLYLTQPWSKTLGDVAADAAPSMGYELVEWQRDFLCNIGAVDSAGKWVHPRVGESVERQQGKSVGLIVWAAFLAAVMGYKVLWTEHNYSTTMEMLERFRAIFGKQPHDRILGRAGWREQLVAVCSQTGQEWMSFRSGGVIQFSTRTKTSRLGFSFDVVIYDEAQELTGVHVQVINPTTTSGEKHNLQLIYSGTPTRAGSTAEVFGNVRKQAWEGGDKASDLMWLEYGVDEIGDIWDESRWWLVMPSLGYHADQRAIRAGMKDLDELGAAQEYLGYWLPDIERTNPPVIGKDIWASRLVDSAPEPTRGERIAYGLRFSPDGTSMALAAAVRPRGSDVIHVELIFSSPAEQSTGKTVPWLAARAGKACSVAIDGKARAGAVYNALVELGLPKDYMIRPSADDAVTAANLVVDGCEGKTLTHVDDPVLKDSAETSWRRQIGKQGGWGFGGENACPIEAVGLAILALKTSKRKPGRKAKVSR